MRNPSARPHVAARAARRIAVIAVVCALVAALGACRGWSSSQPPIHINPNMDDQPKATSQGASDFFADGLAMRTPPTGTVPRDPAAVAYDDRQRTGFEADGTTTVATVPIAVDEALLERGRNRFEIFCTPCHDARGTGRGILFTRANVPTTSLHDAKVTDATDGHVYDVVTNGLGLMSGYRSSLSVRDRWAVVAYVRSLQADYAQQIAGLE